MSRRSSMLVRIAGLMAFLGGLYLSWGTWAVTASGGAATGSLLDFADPSKRMAFASGFGDTLGRELALPRLVLAEPLVWLGIALLAAPWVYDMTSKMTKRKDLAYAGYAYVECPECRHVVPMSSKRCPLCGTQLFAPWSSASPSSLQTPARRS